MAAAARVVQTEAVATPPPGQSLPCPPAPAEPVLPSSSATTTEGQNAYASTSTASGAGEAAEQPALSKSALKRQRKDEAFKAAKLQRRAHEKEKRKAKAAETRRLVAEGLMEKPASKKKKVVGRQSPYGARVVVDMGFDELMTEKEVKSMSSQLAYCYSANRSVQHPFPLLISSFKGRLRQIFENRKDHASWRGVEWWEEGFEALYDGDSEGPGGRTKDALRQDGTGATTSGPRDASPNSISPPTIDLPAPAAASHNPSASEPAAPSSPSQGSSAPPSAPLIQIGALAGRPRSSCPKSSVVYLTGDSPNVLTSLEPGKTYVLGGIVDRNRYKNLCLNKANELGIAHAQLPIGEFLPEMQTRKVLTVNQVYEILINWVADPDGGWREALRKVMPERKFDPDARAKRKAAKKGGKMVDGVYVADEEGDEDEEDDDEGEEGLIVDKVGETHVEAERQEEDRARDPVMADDGSKALP
ncbi:hypothetical protein JCM11251_008006 [Rhodosporidiobolus azoricus]